MAVSNWSTTADANTTVGGVSIAEHCPARNLNDAIRSVMAEAKARFDNDSFPGEVRLFYGTLDANGHPIPLDWASQGITTGVDNWHVCDGTSGTPDMRGRVAVGVASGETLGEISGSDTVTPSITCDSATQSVSIGNTTLSKEQHGTMTARFCGIWASSWEPTGTMVSSYNMWNYPKTAEAWNDRYGPINFSYGSSQTHTHSVTSSTHTHSLSVSNLNNRQASRSLHYIMRVS